MKLGSNLSGPSGPDRWSLADDQPSGLASNPILKQPRPRRFFIRVLPAPFFDAPNS